MWCDTIRQKEIKGDARVRTTRQTVSISLCQVAETQVAGLCRFYLPYPCYQDMTGISGAGYQR
ncbi:hypothetical protein SAMN05660330_02364 [Desulforhopalus singaporensis]|uniref:Uncharacterized protein n=1 Tax=Desulforhopalus singaporensis TaxID=91360 RepID=A0A1H0RLL2_9BACT|nr:hypothetical protein SAMN05660330_02364 [Desulforhopalus singaporensis]